jgi:transposase-like protein
MKEALESYEEVGGEGAGGRVNPLEGILTDEEVAALAAAPRRSNGRFEREEDREKVMQALETVYQKHDGGLREACRLLRVNDNTFHFWRRSRLGSASLPAIQGEPMKKTGRPGVGLHERKELLAYIRGRVREGVPRAEACREAGISIASYYQWTSQEKAAQGEPYLHTLEVKETPAAPREEEQPKAPASGKFVIIVAEGGGIDQALSSIHKLFQQ